MLGLYKGLAQQAQVELISLSTTDQHPVLRRHAPGFTELRLPAGEPIENLARYYEKQLGMSCFDVTVALNPGLLAHAMPWLEAGLERANAVVLSHPYGYALLEQLGSQAPELAQRLRSLPLGLRGPQCRGRPKTVHACSRAVAGLGQTVCPFRGCFRKQA